MKFLSLLLFLLLFARPTQAADADFHPIYNGKDLTDWDGEPELWSVRDGVIQGQTSWGKLVLRNTFLIWRGGVLKDFELKLSFRIASGNSGVQYRSKDLGEWSVSGYQAEVEDTPGKVGFLYEERGRKFLANVGEIVEIAPGGTPKVTARIATKAELIAQGYYRPKQWNDYRIVARGNHLEHWLNGFKTIEVTDSDPAARALQGILALQLHAGLPMRVEFRDILLKNL